MATCQGVVGALQFLIGRPEVDFGTYDAGGTDVAIPIYDDGYTVKETAEYTSQPFKVGRRGDRYRSRSRVNVGGALNTGAFPTAVTKKLLDFAVAVDGNGCLTPWSFQYVTPGVESLQHQGCFVNQLTMSASDGSPDLIMAMDIMGKSEQQIAAPALPTMPTPVAYQFQYGHFLGSVDDGATFALFGTVDSFQLQIDNNLQPGPHVFSPVDYENLTKSFINTGIQKATGNLVLQYSSDDFSDMVRDGVRGELRLMFVHPNSVRTRVNFGAGYAAGSNVNMVVDDSTGFAVGDVVLFRTADTTKVSVATVTVVPDGTHITVDVLDFAVSDNDYIYSMALELRVNSFDALGAPVSGGHADDLKQTLNFEVADVGSGLPFTYKAKAN